METTTAAPTITRCTSCGRTLRAAKSIAAGRGPRCQAKVRAAAKAAVVAEFKPATVAKALELIADNGIVPIRARRVIAFRVVSSDGANRYLTAPQACNCAAGLKAKHACYHRVAATILAAA
ncbi:DUF6011 domain-containing protein [Actinosynnema sp. NPDC059335]|uniref:DUF6011 domain-containing protein n=1 Tax=Actinosynnema sp. NPDC059335 TaxID=3346804 RepID=UPI00366F66DC